MPMSSASTSAPAVASFTGAAAHNYAPGAVAAVAALGFAWAI